MNKEAADRLESLLPLAAIELKAVLGDAGYDAYMELEEGDSNKVELEYAEAYYLLDHLCLSLKQLNATSGSAQTVHFGEGLITAAPYDEMASYRGQFRAEAEKIVARHVNTINGSSDYRVYAI